MIGHRHQLVKMAPDSTDVTYEDWVELYQQRPQSLETVTLRQFVQMYSRSGGRRRGGELVDFQGTWIAGMGICRAEREQEQPFPHTITLTTGRTLYRRPRPAVVRHSYIQETI